MNQATSLQMMNSLFLLCLLLVDYFVHILRLLAQGCSRQAQKAMNPDSPYAELSKMVSEGVRERFKETSSSSPMQVAEVILTAIKSEKPNTRYLVGNDAIAINERRKSSSDSELERWIKEGLLEQKGFINK
jgi:hypothetical protein